ncbi:hypothetical protein H112_04627 [Trichophyton rubrum D6]|uniref:Uncharacterized protein n=3 Tax=Trichophyton TaxID=5550 RepID=F2SN85_TRIRC|nr:uncharacterized protein TERG_04397 [Trichophyton rubrum CBS 118892]EZF22572.1 hypothetical protein H100_04635 [Trichophyton rubrum MR850]EZF41616.1 hypothetical protein H102_04623 [Trichophyton rubrum CBS 100081]EZF52209.1 hypothetical protein H103_04629 [Trichophyton rubrum CBS 288.86]EZF62886.1 hypothetical protein H104_04616 [Trichophyton rubrum CBS 289.86]EZF73596.1 hypothetical protein H105_04645 [Trichophyton soudanense CBS 452.61]EZF84181.1 hypothetical protein H110_04624 [Trichophy
MRFALLAIVISAFVTSTYAQREYYIRNEPSGLNVTWDDDDYIYMEPGIRKYTISAWNMYPVASDIKNWFAFGASYFYLQFDFGRDGDTALRSDEGRIFEIRKAESHSYVIDVQSVDSGQPTLAWTVERNSTDPRVFLKLRPYMRLPSQQFTFTPK